MSRVCPRVCPQDRWKHYHSYHHAPSHSILLSGSAMLGLLLSDDLRLGLGLSVIQPDRVLTGRNWLARIVAAVPGDGMRAG